MKKHWTEWLCCVKLLNVETPKTVLTTPRFPKLFWLYPDTKNRFAYTHTPKTVLSSLPPENVFYLHSDSKNSFNFAYTPKTVLTTHRLQISFWLHTDSNYRFSFIQTPKNDAKYSTFVIFVFVIYSVSFIPFNLKEHTSGCWVWKNPRKIWWRKADKRRTAIKGT